MDVFWHHELWDRYLDRDTNVFHCASNHNMQKAIKLWRESPARYGRDILESYKEWNWAYGWNAIGEGSGGGNELGNWAPFPRSQTQTS